MTITPKSSKYTELDYIRDDEDGGATYLEVLYNFLLTDNSFAELWSHAGSDSAVIPNIFDSLAVHLSEWNQENENTGIEWLLKDDGLGWLGLEPEVEEGEFEVLKEIWELSQASVAQHTSDGDFFKQAEWVSKNSQLFSLLQEMKVIRANGTIKNVWPHVENVVTHLHSEETTDFELRSAPERQALLRFTAFVHDLFNVVAIDNDWLQLHAHGGSAFLYRFFVVKMGFDPAEAASIARVVDLHHLLQLLKIGDVTQRDRVMEPENVAEFYAERPSGLEELSRLIQFSLADVGRQPGQFRSEHIAATLALLRQFVEVDSTHDDEKKRQIAQQAVEQAAQTIAYLEMQAASIEEKAPFYQQLASEIEKAASALESFIVAILGCPQAIFAESQTVNTSQ